MRTGEFGTKISNEIFPTEPIICVKEDLRSKSPNSLKRTFLNAVIIRNSDTSLAGLVQLRRGKNLFTERFK